MSCICSSSCCITAADTAAQQLHYIGCWHCNTPAALKELQLYMLLALQYRAVAALQAHFGLLVRSGAPFSLKYVFSMLEYAVKCAQNARHKRWRKR
jgi:hypothetical protein